MKSHGRIFSLTVLALAASVPPSLAQNGKVALHVSPKQAYLYVDGQAISEASKHHTLSLSPGDHKIELVNYGYAPETRSVNITAGKTTSLDVTLQPVSGKVAGPFGAITIEGADRDAILLNGKTPEFTVGHGDEFDNDWGWKQELVVPPGNFQLTVMKGDKEIWSGSVEVAASKRVVIDIPKGVRKTVDWPRGEKLTDIPRFTVGTASATVAVAKPTAQLSAATAQVDCGGSSKLNWTSSDAPRVEISGVGPVAATGDQSIEPKQTTTYNLIATGPGGTVTSTATVNVNNAVQANLQLSPAEVHYKRIGDKVVQDDNTALNWSAANASSVSIDGLGTVEATGSRSLQPAPKKTDAGPVDENVTYTLTASNGCGGTETRTAVLHIVGDIEQPETQLTMRSVYFPSNRPRSIKSEAALLPSEREALQSIAAAFKTYLTVKPDAHLMLSGHADKRGPASYNQALSERRAELAKRFLIEQGVPEANLETHAYGKGQNLTVEQVKELLEQNPNLTPDERQKELVKIQTVALANNRRVDITLTTTGQESARTYPFNTADYAALVSRGKPVEEGKVENAAEKEKLPK
ncbi:MAG TPA: OmpA family protein [Candidatus Aquilonibacter sp.]|nr:OmpA family protein [Candidatus Aquilonibacter sp.]